MSFQITTAFVSQYRANLYMQVQQKGSRLRMAVRNETQKGESEFFERLASTVAQVRTSRHSDTLRVDSQHSRRRLTLADYEWADLIDQQDKIRLLIDPTSGYMQNALYALGRAIDDVIIAGAVGNAWTDHSGGTAVPMPNSQQIVPVSGGAAANMNVAAMIQAKQFIDAKDVDPDLPRHMAMTASQISALLQNTQVTSADYNNVKALVEGKIDTFLGFKIHRLERLLTTAGSLTFDTAAGTVGSGGGTLNAGARQCIAWVQDGIILSTGEDFKGEITPRPDKSYSTQVYARGSWGAVRMEEEKVVIINCKES